MREDERRDTSPEEEEGGRARTAHRAYRPDCPTLTLIGLFGNRDALSGPCISRVSLRVCVSQSHERFSRGWNVPTANDGSTIVLAKASTRSTESVPPRDEFRRTFETKGWRRRTTIFASGAAPPHPLSLPRKKTRRGTGASLRNVRTRFRRNGSSSRGGGRSSRGASQSSLSAGTRPNRDRTTFAIVEVVARMAVPSSPSSRNGIFVSFATSVRRCDSLDGARLAARKMDSDETTGPDRTGCVPDENIGLVQGEIYIYRRVVYIFSIRSGCHTSIPPLRFSSVSENGEAV
mmetsp:Transcript_30320/g.57331  ORF Transcript_30320/g.57331 Transcript_30320/m.57331 type:complete len:290 (+) Transcript_30320:850-1719(+)